MIKEIDDLLEKGDSLNVTRKINEVNFDIEEKKD